MEEKTLAESEPSRDDAEQFGTLTEGIGVRESPPTLREGRETSVVETGRNPE